MPRQRAFKARRSSVAAARDAVASAPSRRAAALASLPKAPAARDVVIEVIRPAPPDATPARACTGRPDTEGELVVLAVRAADSRQGQPPANATVSQRGVPARSTTAAGHDDCY
ncbi:hypothetical protein GCM10017688_41040 [Streptomyces ramulosus]